MQLAAGTARMGAKRTADAGRKRSGCFRPARSKSGRQLKVHETPQRPPRFGADVRIAHLPQCEKSRSVREVAVKIIAPGVSLGGRTRSRYRFGRAADPNTPGRSR